MYFNAGNLCEHHVSIFSVCHSAIDIPAVARLAVCAHVWRCVRMCGGVCACLAVCAHVWECVEINGTKTKTKINIFIP